MDKEEYISYFMSPRITEPEKDILYYTTIIYEYNCETYDRYLSQREFGEIRLLHGSSYVGYDLKRFSILNARAEYSELQLVFNKLGGTRADFNKFKDKINRYSYEYLKEIFDNIPKEMLYKIKELIK